jgi:hypothetical protein
LESFVTKKRDNSAALKFLKRALKRYGPAGLCQTNQHLVSCTYCELQSAFNLAFLRGT